MKIPLWYDSILDVDFQLVKNKRNEKNILWSFSMHIGNYYS